MNREIGFTDYICLECGRSGKNRRSLGNHLARTHSSTIEEYCLKHYFNGIIPLCKCNCGKEVSWHKSQYKYNDYISGHNEAGFFTNGWKPSKEQINKRNEAIRKAYKEKGTKIKRKISNSLVEAFSQPGMSEKLSATQREGWNKPGVKERVSKIRKKVWQEQGDELRKKIFTKEFGRKIALANSKRNTKRTSAAEQLFIKKVGEILGTEEISPNGKWVNTDDNVKHYDLFIKSENLLVEYDGLYWHGLDRITNFTCAQINNMANDFLKNRIAIDLGFSLIRIKEGTDISKIKSLNDLKSIAYHHQLADGTFIKDGMFRFKDDSHALLTREHLIRINESEIFTDAKGREYTETELKPAIISFLRQYVQTRGWFYPTSNEKASDIISKLQKRRIDESNGEISSLGNTGSSYLKSKFKSYWNVDSGPYESFWDDKKLDKVLSYRLGLNNSKLYDYKLKCGTSISCKETFDISPKNIRFGFVVQRNSVSWFKPSAAYEIYKLALGNIEKPVVWDPSCGFGARMIGFAAAYPNGTYIGTDPAKQTFEDLRNLSEKLDVKTNLNNTCSEVFDPNCELDLVFTSPPYFDKEKYFNENTQCWKKFPNIENWKKMYLLPTLRTAYRRLRAGKLLIINIDEKNAKHVKDIAISLGFIEERQMNLIIGRDHFSKKKGIKAKKSEPILIFKR